MSALQQSSYIKVVVPPKSSFKDRVRKRSEELGMPMGTVLRVAFDNYDLLLQKREEENIPLLSGEISESAIKGLADYKEGKVTELNTDKEIDEYFKAL